MPYKYEIDAAINKHMNGIIYFQKHKLRLLAARKIHRPHQRQNEYQKIKDHYESWRGFIPEQVACECCGKIVFYRSGNIRTSIHFDHRNEGLEVVQVPPSEWLRRHKCNDENKKIWESCDFGMLCFRCNSQLPTKGRLEFLESALKYAKGQTYENCDSQRSIPA